MMIAATLSAPICFVIWSMAWAEASTPAFSAPVGQR